MAKKSTKKTLSLDDLEMKKEKISKEIIEENTLENKEESTPIVEEKKVIEKMPEEDKIATIKKDEEKEKNDIKFLDKNLNCIVKDWMNISKKETTLKLISLKNVDQNEFYLKYEFTGYQQNTLFPMFKNKEIK